MRNLFALLSLVLIAVAAAGCVGASPYRNMDGDSIHLRVGQSKLIVQKQGASPFIGGYVAAFYVENRSIAELEARADGIYIVGKNAGSTTGAPTNWAYLDEQLEIRDSSASGMVAESLRNKPVRIIVD